MEHQGTQPGSLMVHHLSLLHGCVAKGSFWSAGGLASKVFIQRSSHARYCTFIIFGCVTIVFFKLLSVSGICCTLIEWEHVGMLWI